MASNCTIFSDPLNDEKERIQMDRATLDTFTSDGFKLLIEATKKSNNLPVGKCRDLYESYPSFHDILQNQADCILSVLSTMTKRSNCPGCIKEKDDEDKFEMIVESNDTLLENVGITLDELSGIMRNPETKFTSKGLVNINGSWNKNKTIIDKGATQLLNRILGQTKNIEKPQLKFKDKVDNNPNTPFEPRIKHKYNMLKPLACISEIMDNGLSQFTHPYEFELGKFKPSQEQLMYQSPILHKPLKETPLVFVTLPENVIQVVNDLEKYKEIAVDLEHHSYRSFQGFTCLMQISTRDTDYIIDTLALRSDLEMLNKVFTNPSIVKVFHGADLDILWLQRDLSLYIVNMFDTHQAAKLLNFPKLSLGYLLSHYCNVNAQKQFQLADWRVSLCANERLVENISETQSDRLPLAGKKVSFQLMKQIIKLFLHRPLPQELLTYAREDTHYLLFIYDNMRNALLEKSNYQTNLLESVISESARICSKRYLKPVYDAEGYLDLYHRSKKLFDNRQKFALQQLFEWRDTVARNLDESYAYVFPDHMMLNVSEVLPREVQGILACCNPIPVPVRQNVLALHQIILKAREQPLVKPVLEEERLYRYAASVRTFDDPLLCPHDLNHEGDTRDDMPVLFNGSDRVVKSDENSSSCTTREWPKPIVNVFERLLDVSEKVKLQQLIANTVMHLTPYLRYKLSKTFSESVEVSRSSKTDEHDLVKRQGSALSKSDDHVRETCDESIEKYEKNFEDSVLNEEKDSCGRKIKSNAKEQTGLQIHVNKRKMKDENLKEPEPKKPKGEGEGDVVNPCVCKDKEVRNKKKKKKIFLEKKDKEFEPFNYGSIDFKKYKSSEVTAANKAPRKPKIKKKLGKKNFKISI